MFAVMWLLVGLFGWVADLDGVVCLVWCLVGLALLCYFACAGC